MKRSLLLLPCLLSILTLAAGRADGQAAAAPTPVIQNGGEVAAQSAAEVWLAITDDGRYEVAYQSTASILQKLVTKEQWTKMVAAGRGPLGKVVTRKMKDAKFTATMPGAPDGQYVVLHYETSFEKKPAAVETVTMLLDTDGQWKPCGYFIR